MARYREFRKIDSDMVRSMCIRESYYTRGGILIHTDQDPAFLSGRFPRFQKQGFSTQISSDPFILR